MKANKERFLELVVEDKSDGKAKMKARVSKRKREKMNYPITILENHKRIMRQMEKELKSKGNYPQEEIDKVNELMDMVDEAIKVLKDEEVKG